MLNRDNCLRNFIKRTLRVNQGIFFDGDVANLTILKNQSQILFQFKILKNFVRNSSRFWINFGQFVVSFCCFVVFGVKLMHCSLVHIGSGCRFKFWTENFAFSSVKTTNLLRLKAIVCMKAWNWFLAIPRYLVLLLWLLKTLS